VTEALRQQRQIAPDATARVDDPALGHVRDGDESLGEVGRDASLWVVVGCIAVPPSGESTPDGHLAFVHHLSAVGNCWKIGDSTSSKASSSARRDRRIRKTQACAASGTVGGGSRHEKPGLRQGLLNGECLLR